MKNWLKVTCMVILFSLISGLLFVPGGLLENLGQAIAQKAPSSAIESKAPIMAPTDSIDAAVIWRGFDQKWTTANHRLNRLGDYVGGINFNGQSCSANLVHSAASGLAGDMARHTTYYTQITARGVGFQPGNRSFTLSGSEGSPITKEIPVSATADANMRGRGQYVAVLNGFDLCATESADKLEHLYIAVTNPSYNQADNKLKFKIKVGLTANCGSAECPSKNDVDYQMRVYYVIIGGETEAFHTVSGKFSKHYNWDKSDEIHLRDLNERHTLQGEAGYPTGVFAFRWLEVDLNRDHWMFEWASYVRPLSYDQTGKGDFDLALMFKQWTTGMRAGAVKKEGSATIKARVILLQFQDANRRNDGHNGSIHWAGTEGGASSGACSDDAVTRHEIQFSAEI